MNIRPTRLDQAIVAALALNAGSTAGSLADMILAHANDASGLGKLAAAAVTLWVFDRLAASTDHDH
jgi:hypothetical protein